MSIEIACVIMGLFGWVLGIYCGSKLNTKEKPKCEANESCENFEGRKESESINN